MRSSSWPLTPTKGLPARSSSAPGASPISITRAAGLPSPNTRLVAVFFSGQPSKAASASASSVRSRAAAASRLKQLAAERGREVSVCVIEKGSEVGAHILSGAVIDPIALDELIPDWRDKGAPLLTPVTDDRFLILGERGSLRIPAWMLP